MAKFSISTVKGGGLVVARNDRIIGSIGKAVIGSFPRASGGDDSIWTGSPTWGPGTKERLENPYDQMMYYTSWNYICIRYNATQVSRQRLRLYMRKRKGPQPGRLMTRAYAKPVPRELKQFLYTRKGLDPWLSQAEDVEEITQHPWLETMKKPNPILSGSEFWVLTETYMGLTGDAFWWKRPSQGKAPYQLWIMESQNVRIVPGQDIDQYLLGYLYSTGRRQVPFDAEEVVHYKYANPLVQLKGYSPLQGISDSVITNEWMYRYDKATFRNMARPDGVLETEESLGDKEYRRLKREWNSQFGGVDSTGKVLILEGKAKYKQITMSPKDLNHQVGRKMTREEIADGHGVPMPLLSPDSSNLAVSKVAYSQYMRDTIDPKLRMYEDGINANVLSDYPGGEDLFCAFDDCVPADREMQLRERELNLKMYYSTVNQERAKDGEDPQEDYGDDPLVTGGVQPLSEALKPKPQLGYTVGPNGEPIFPPEPEEEKKKPEKKPAKESKSEDDASIKALAKGIVENLFERLKGK